MTADHGEMPVVREVTLHVTGMFCTHCKSCVETALRKAPGVLSASVDFARGSADVHYDESKTVPDTLIACVEAAGYEASTEYGGWPDWLRSFSLLVMIISSWLLLEKTGLLAIFSPSRIASGRIGIAAMFITGLATSAHCVAMCGGIALSQCLGGGFELRRPLLYNAGRVLSYALGGLLLGSAGALLPASFSPGMGAFVSGAIKALAGLCMIVMGLRMLNLVPALRRLTLFHSSVSRRITAGAPFAVGLLNGLMPCGPLQAAQIAAFASGSAASGAAAMGAFALGTVPLMLLLGVFAVSLGRRFLRAVSSAGAAIVCVLGLSMISQGSGLTGMIDERQILLWAAVISAVILAAALPAASRPVRAILAAVCLALGVWSITGKRGEPDREQFFSVVEGSVQTVTTQLRPGSFPTLTVRAGIPVRWIITVDERNINGCNYQAVLPEFGIKHTFVPGENVIEFLPQVPGEFPYSCWMGMIRGAIVVLKAPHK